MKNNKGDPAAIIQKAQRVYDFYRKREIVMLSVMNDKDWENTDKIRVISETQKRRAFAARIIGK